MPEAECDEDKPCCDGAGTCEKGICTCADNENACGAVCIDAELRNQKDPNNCGERGHICAEGEECCGGICYPPEHFLTDPERCGACCTACTADQICCDGTCQSVFVSVTETRDACCPTEQSCSSTETENCCAETDTCIDGACCPDTSTCGANCCPDDSFCYCDACVSDLATCASDFDCCAGSCVQGYCCPVASTCTDNDGAVICCGGLHICDAESATCLAIESSTPVRPNRPIEH